MVLAIVFIVLATLEMSMVMIMMMNARQKRSNVDGEVNAQIENVFFVMGRKAHVLSEVERRKNRQKVRGEIVSRIIHM